MDLGQLISDVSQQYIKYKYGAPAVASGMGMQQYVPPPVPVAAAGGGITRAAFDMPFVDVVGDPGGLVAKAVATGGKLVYDYVTGKWKIQRRRRRRKRLATATDVKDLAALSAVVGKGAAFREWIATHPSY